MPRKFDLAAAFAQALGPEVSNSDTGREQIEYIGLERIDPDPGNFYSLDGIEDLAANIQLCGLQQPLRVRPGEEPGRYTVVSGHRRREALLLLAGSEPDGARWSPVPCLVERDEASPELRELRMIYANRSSRRLTDAELSRQAQEVERLLYALKEQGYAFPGRMRDQVAAACQVSAPKLARLKVIREKLSAAWTALFDRDALPEQTAYALARMPEELQERLSRVCGDKPPSGAAAGRILEAGRAGAQWTPRFTCPDGRPCRRGDAFLRHDVEVPLDMCLGERCCLECREATARCGPCARMCSKAKALRKDARDGAKAGEEARRAKQQRAYRAAIQASAARLLRAAEAAGLDGGTELQISRYGLPLTVDGLRDYAAGEFGDRYFYANDLAPQNYGDPAALARALRCSADYLLGLSDELRPAGEDWRSGDPEAEGYYWCLTGPLHGCGGLYYWAGRWEFPQARLAANIQPVYWLPCPPIPEGLTWPREGV